MKLFIAKLTCLFHSVKKGNAPVGSDSDLKLFKFPEKNTAVSRHFISISLV